LAKVILANFFVGDKKEKDRIKAVLWPPRREFAPSYELPAGKDGAMFRTHFLSSASEGEFVLPGSQKKRPH